MMAPFPVVAGPGDDLQQAIDAAAGRVLHLLPGTYKLREVIVRQPLHIEGEGQRFTILEAAAGSAFGLRFDVPRLRYTRVQGLSVFLPAGFAGAALSFPYGLQHGCLSDLEILGQGSGTGIELRGAHPTAGPNTNQYMTCVRNCLFESLTLGVFLQGLPAVGAYPNCNHLLGCTFSDAVTHVVIQQGALNTIEKCNFNPVRQPGPRVAISGSFAATELLSCYWDNLGQDVCVRQRGFNTKGGRQGLVVSFNNQPKEAFDSDGPVVYQGIYA